MNFEDLLGSVITLFALAFLFISFLWNLFIKKPPSQPPLEVKDQLQHFFEEKKPKKEPVHHPKVPKVKKAPPLPPARKRISRGKALLERLPSKKEMVILHEIIGPPKGLS